MSKDHLATDTDLPPSLWPEGEAPPEVVAAYDRDFAADNRRVYSLQPDQEEK